MSQKPLLALILISIFFISASAATAAEAKMNATQKESLHRADFKVEGASCVNCLRRIAATFRKDRGVKRADVSVFRPYWSIVIYDSNQTNFNNLVGSICKQEKVKMVEIEDKPIDAVPTIIIPKGIGLQRSQEHQASNPAPEAPVSH